MKIRTGKGDTGFTDLLFRQRISKASHEIRAIGDLDELGSYLGLIKVKIKGRKKKDMLEKIQRAIYVIASEIAIGPEKKKKAGHLLSDKDTHWIESVVYELEGKTAIKKHFYLPGDNELSAFIDIARTVARRTERSIVELFSKKGEENQHILSYLNCLSDVLFLMASRKGKAGKKRG